MNMRKEIQNAFDNVHAPDELVERMKQELYQKDLHEDIEEITFQVMDAPKRHIWRYMAYVAVALALCIGCGVSVMSLRENPFNPASPVVPTTEETTESENLTAEKEIYIEKSIWAEEQEKKAAAESAAEKMRIEANIRIQEQNK